MGDIIFPLGRFVSYTDFCVMLFPLQSLGNSQREYEKHVLLYSIRNQLRFRNNLGEPACSAHQLHLHRCIVGLIIFCFMAQE